LKQETAILQGLVLTFVSLSRLRVSLGASHVALSRSTFGVRNEPGGEAREVDARRQKGEVARTAGLEPAAFGSVGRLRA